MANKIELSVEYMGKVEITSKLKICIYEIIVKDVLCILQRTTSLISQLTSKRKQAIFEEFITRKMNLL